MSIDPNQERQDRADGTKKDGQNEPASEPVGFIVDPQGNPYSHTYKPYQKFKNLIKRVLEKIPHADKLMILLTAAVAIATFGQVGIAWYSNHTTGKTQTDQFNQMKSVADRMEGAANSFAGNSANINQSIAAATMKLQAQAEATETARKTSESNSKQSLDATISNFHQDERGWLGFVDPSIVLKKDTLNVRVNAMILGKSPVVDIRSHLGLKAYPREYELKLSDLVLHQNVVKNGTAIPGSSFPLKNGSQDPPTEQEKIVIDAVMAKTMVLYFYGETRYRDIFEVEHWTHFCFIIPSEDMAKSSPCPMYNDSDADHDTQKKKH